MLLNDDDGPGRVVDPVHKVVEKLWRNVTLQETMKSDWVKPSIILWCRSVLVHISQNKSAFELIKGKSKSI